MREFYGICFFLIGYVYPFVVVFRGGSLGQTIRNIWPLLILITVFLCICIPAMAAMFSPELSMEVSLFWVPEAPLVVAILLGGWMMPLIGGVLGLFVRRLSLKWFPRWMNCISFPIH